MRLVEVEEVAEESTNSLLYSPSGSDSRVIRKVRAPVVCLDAAGTSMLGKILVLVHPGLD
eukprot:scaffold91112_cov47-Attheya_sp.AAC.4